MLTLRLDGEENFYRSLITIERKVDALSKDWLDEMGEFVVSSIRENWSANSPSDAGAPPAIDSGNLDSSLHLERVYRDMGGRFASKGAASRIHIRVNTLEGDRPNGYNYAPALETGTYKMEARPFMMPALERAASLGQTIAKRVFRL